MTLKLPHDPRKIKKKTAQLLEVTEKLCKYRRYREKACFAMEKLPNALKAIQAIEDGPTGR